MFVLKNIYISWDAPLTHTDDFCMKTYNKHFEVELITNMDMNVFIESFILGGLSQIS